MSGLEYVTLYNTKLYRQQDKILEYISTREVRLWRKGAKVTLGGWYIKMAQTKSMGTACTHANAIDK